MLTLRCLPYKRPCVAAWLGLAALIVAALTLAGCDVATKSAEFTKDRIENYCATTTPEARDLLRQQIVHPDGSPMIQVYCEPHGLPPAE